MIEKYFSNYVDKFHKMKVALKRYVDAKDDFYSLSGVQYDKVSVQGGKPNTFADIMANIENLYQDYKEREMEYEKEKQSCLDDINQIKNPIYEAILEYAYLDFDDDKTICDHMNEYHKKNYSTNYIRAVKLKAKKEFENIIKKTR